MTKNTKRYDLTDLNILSEMKSLNQLQLPDLCSINKYIKASPNKDFFYVFEYITLRRLTS